MNERFDPRARWTVAPGAGPIRSDVPAGFTVRWRTGVRIDAESDVRLNEPGRIDLRDEIDVRPRARLTWEREPGQEILDRIVFRILGDQAMTRTIVDRVMGSSAVVEPRRVVTEALSETLEHRGPLGEVRVLRIDGVAFGDHRRRLCRDLLRWPTAERVMLALRHLGELPINEIAVIMDSSGEQTRAVTSTWWPDEEDSHSTERAALRPLLHLDPIGSPVRV